MSCCTPDAQGPDVHYYMIRGGTDMRNITVWEPGESRRRIHQNVWPLPHRTIDETYWFLLGEGVLLQQKLVEVDGVRNPIASRNSKRSK